MDEEYGKDEDRHRLSVDFLLVLCMLVLVCRGPVPTRGHALVGSSDVQEA